MENKNNKKDKFNNEKNGLFIGLIIPIISTLLYYLFLAPGSIIIFLKQIFIYGTHTKMLGLTIIPNFLIYFYFRWKTKYKIAEGMSIATLIFLIVIVILRYLR
jgi:hypothetical protein